MATINSAPIDSSHGEPVGIVEATGGLKTDAQRADKLDELAAQLESNLCTMGDRIQAAGWLQTYAFELRNCRTPPPVAELVASIQHYFKNYMLDEADDDHVCNTDAQHDAAVRVRAAITAMSGPQSAPQTFSEVQWPRRRLSITFTHDTCGDNLFHPMIEDAAREYFAADPAGTVWTFVASNGVRVDVTSHELQQWEKTAPPEPQL